MTAAAVLTVGAFSFADDAPVDPAASVEGHLKAGEFGAALDVARKAAGPGQQQLVGKVVAAQIKANDMLGAQGALMQMATPGEAGPARAEMGRQEALAGGFGADFTALIDLITEHTEGPWLDVDGLGGTVGEFESGIRVDPQGVLTRNSSEDESGRLAALGMSARQAALNEDLARASNLRMVSLTRLEQEIAARLAEGKPVVESMKNLAGLSKIQYVFVYPETQEVVIAGPAEGWQYDEHGLAVGTESGRPTLHLDDLVTVLRTFDNAGQQGFGCSIDPKAENIKDLKEFAAASQAKGPLDSRTVRGWATKLGQILGRQDITIYGVPKNSRVSRVLVEADYRMKLIGVGKLDGGSQVPDYFELLAKNPSVASGGLDALRWWLTMNYDEVLHDGDRNTFELRGSSVKCQSENQFLTATGQRVNSGSAEPVNQQFAANFTEHYADLAKREPIFADLQGVFDLALVAALIDQENVDGRLGWDRGVFADGGAYRPATYAVPQEVDTVVNHRVYGGKDIVVQVAGGVTANVAAVLQSADTGKSSPALDAVSDAAQAAELPAGRWWWDAK